ncbi:class I adenylate-forming enzyme family protein [Zhengella sp. ZM62]|uniref:class I adenylate-forming enzyme family protein n=1 Tax=Zhengella sedimenti TaxID=3390035 RepID=UPI003974E778
MPEGASLAQASGAGLWTQGLSVPALLRHQAGIHGASLALSAESAGESRVRLDYASLCRRMDAAAAILRQAGLGRQERLAIYLTNVWALECYVAALGALALGAVVVPLNTRSSDAELGHAVALTGPRLVVSDGPGRSRLAEALGSSVPGLLDATLFSRLEAEDEGLAPEAIPPDLLGCLLFTSGTTALSKAVMHSHATMVATGLCTGTALGLRHGDIYQGAFPFFTSSALNLAAMSCWVAGAGLVIEGQIGNEERLDLIRAERTTFYHGVPSILNFMTQAFDPARHDLSGVRRVANGGAAMPLELVATIGRLWPWADQVQIYGMTESGPAGTVLEPDMMTAKAGSVGRAMPHMRVEVVDDAGRALPAGEEGEIALSGPAVALGYFRNEEATAKAFSGQRILTGDVGRLDGDGYLFFGDRKKDVINRGGLKISSVAVESALYRHPAVREAAVFATPHPQLGDDVAACIVLKPGQSVTADALATHCRADLADYEVPRHFAFVAELPKNPMGKILKKELRDNPPPMQRVS